MELRIKIINWLIRFWKVDTNKISDGYHTYEELYKHRILLFISLMRQAQQLGYDVWVSSADSHGRRDYGWIIAGIGKEPGQQITYHMKESYFHLLSFAECLIRAPEFDGHTSTDVLDRLRKLIKRGAF